jgi:protein-L-isoaspartate(D-aspartate) O-methyltransferase
MIAELLARRGLADLPHARARMRARLAGLGAPDRLLAAIDAVPRHAFVPASHWRIAYAEAGLWLPSGLALPTPEATLRILAALHPPEAGRVLELGTGTGYLAALLGQLAAWVVTVDLADRTAGALADAELPGVRQVIGAGTAAIAADPPFDAVLYSEPVAALPTAMPGQTVVAVVGTPGWPQRLLAVRPGTTDGAPVVTDHGPILVPSPAMAQAVAGGVPMPAALEGGALA